MTNESYYKVGGPLSETDKSYVKRQADDDIINLVKKGEHCYVFNSNQTGKTSLVQHTANELQKEGFACIITDFLNMGKGEKQQWYNTLINNLSTVKTNDNSNVLSEFDVDNWLNDQEKRNITPEFLLSTFIKEVLLEKIPKDKNLVIFIDEIGSLKDLDFSDDFLDFIRSSYTNRENDPFLKRLVFVLLGVTTIGKLRKDPMKADNTIKSVNLQGFTTQEAIEGLAQGLKDKAEDCEKVIEAILYWTEGQPFLTQKLCQLVEQGDDFIEQNEEKEFIDKLVKSSIINYWIDEKIDVPKHFEPIQTKLLSKDKNRESRLRLYKRILDDENQNADIEVILELQLTGLLIEKDKKLKIYNPIYKEVFNKEWVESQLTSLKFQSELYTHQKKRWLESGKDKKHLLVGDNLTKAEEWQKERATLLSKEDNEFLDESQKNKASDNTKWQIIAVIIAVLLIILVAFSSIYPGIEKTKQIEIEKQQQIELSKIKENAELEKYRIDLEKSKIEAEQKRQQYQLEAEIKQSQLERQRNIFQKIWHFFVGSILLPIELVKIPFNIIGFVIRLVVH